MKQALILYGPSASGKTTIINKIIANYDFKHVDTDVFRHLFSDKRSEERTAIAGVVACAYAEELVKRGYHIVIEALPDKYLDELKRILKKNNYEINEVSLKSTLEQCLKNNAQREKKRQMSEKAIKESFEWYSYERGLVIDRMKNSIEETYKKIEKEYLS